MRSIACAALLLAAACSTRPLADGLPPGPFSCAGGCHALPGESGAHAAHFATPDPWSLSAYGDTRAPADYPAESVAGYVFGCGNCHPLDAARHMDGTLDVDLAASGAPAGSLKSRNGAGAARADDGTCSEVYCHSSGQAEPTFAVTPPWTSGASLGCGGCHGNPPRYPSGPAGSATANTHLVSRSQTYTDPSTGETTVYTGGYGHFAWHDMGAAYTQPWSGQHGVDDAGVANGTFGAAPMTCQTCHYDTVDPAATGPSGYYWLNTTGDYLVDGQNYTGYTCTTSDCHDDQPGRAPSGAGGVLPLRHVNGNRDVVFDPRTEPSPYGAPTDAAAPELPYWVSVFSFNPAGVLQPGAAYVPGTVSFRLDGAGYDPATKTCSAVPCHLKQTEVQWGGTDVGSWGTCFDCHASH